MHLATAPLFFPSFTPTGTSCHGVPVCWDFWKIHVNWILLFYSFVGMTATCLLFIFQLFLDCLHRLSYFFVIVNSLWHFFQRSLWQVWNFFKFQHQGQRRMTVEKFTVATVWLQRDRTISCLFLILRLSKSLRTSAPVPWCNVCNSWSSEEFLTK